MKDLVAVFLLITLASACASQEQIIRSHESAASGHARQAEEWRSAGNDVVAQHHDEAAKKERQDSVAASCGFFDELLFGVILSTDACH